MANFFNLPAQVQHGFTRPQINQADSVHFGQRGRKIKSGAFSPRKLAAAALLTLTSLTGCFQTPKNIESYNKNTKQSTKLVVIPEGNRENIPTGKYFYPTDDSVLTNVLGQDVVTDAEQATELFNTYCERKPKKTSTESEKALVTSAP